MHIAMVGTGRMATSHTEHLATLPDVVLDTVVGIDEPTAREFAEKHGYDHATAELDAALERDRIDAVYIATPSRLHARQTRAALEARKHVLCEIPLALDLQEVIELGELADRVDRKLQINHTERFRLGRMALRQRIAAGELHPLQVHARFHMLRRQELQTADEREAWQDNALWHHGAHTVDGVISLLGQPEVEDLAVQHRPPFDELSVPLDWQLQWHTPDDVLVSVSLSHNSHWNKHDYHFICEEDTLVCDHGTLRNKERVLVEGDGWDGTRQRQNEAFVQAVKEDRRPPVDVREILPTMRVLERAWRTFELGDEQRFRREVTS